jgi:hypothetical protein
VELTFTLALSKTRAFRKLRKLLWHKKKEYLHVKHQIAQCIIGKKVEKSRNKITIPLA